MNDAQQSIPMLQRPNRDWKTIGSCNGFLTFAFYPQAMGTGQRYIKLGYSRVYSLRLFERVYFSRSRKLPARKWVSQFLVFDIQVSIVPPSKKLLAYK